MKKILVTGATSGIGRYLVEAFAKQQIDLVLVGRSSDMLQKLATELEQKYAIQCLPKVVNLTDLDAVKRLPQECPVDGVINCAGIGEVGDFLSLPLSAELDEIKINYLAPMILSKLYSQQFIHLKEGLILNVCSTAALYSHPYMSNYGASKSALFQYSLGLKEELRACAPQVQVVTVCPGPTKTHFFDGKVNVGFQTSWVARKGQMAPDKVAQLVMKQLAKSKSYHLIGNRNKWTTFLLRCLPTTLRLRVVGNYLQKGVL